MSAVSQQSLIWLLSLVLWPGITSRYFSLWWRTWRTNRTGVEQPRHGVVAQRQSLFVFGEARNSIVTPREPSILRISEKRPPRLGRLLNPIHALIAHHRTSCGLD